MLGDKWLKVAAGIWILSAVGGGIALSNSATIAGVVESVGYLRIWLAMLFGKRIAVHFRGVRRMRRTGIQGSMPRACAQHGLRSAIRHIAE